MEVPELLELVAKNNASDLHLLVGFPPIIRADGELLAVEGQSFLDEEAAEKLIFPLMTPEQKEIFLANKELDFSFPFVGSGSTGEARFRVNAYYQRGYISAALRYLPPKIKTIEDLNLPKILHEFTKLRQGFILVTGPTGHGKSTTLASIINEINQDRSCHIVTVEDPIEYTYPPGKSIISQRELRLDTYSWEIALRSVLREDPDVVLIGEMRDYETIAAALTIAETGHLVFSTLHTNSSAQTIDRIIDVFPEHQQTQVRLQLSMVLEAVFSMRLIPQIGGGRVPTYEMLLATPAVKNTIREGKTHLIDNIIQTSAELGMSSLETSLASLVRQGKISLETAQSFAIRPDDLLRLVNGR
ncbi:type IV pilus twitching motility protein PilT [Candidatus Microgenomates bacterium]|nr:type IV pilus twitching motility protein PilT [Candidatus Microgenomates bacterium]